jgi:hypothetical protein
MKTLDREDISKVANALGYRTFKNDWFTYGAVYWCPRFALAYRRKWRKS